MEDMFSRAELLLGRDGLERLKRARVAVFGIGGVGSFAAEALARGGIGHIALVDGDRVSLTNLNRQLIATQKTIGRLKTDVMAERIREISPAAVVECYPVVYGAENKELLDFAAYDYIIDAIDTVTSKLLLIEQAKSAGTQIISCMGTGNKLDPTRFEIADIAETSVCPLAKVMRKELKARGISGVPVVFSKEPPLRPAPSAEAGKKQIPGSLSFVPPAAGMILAGAVIRAIAGIR